MVIVTGSALSLVEVLLLVYSHTTRLYSAPLFLTRPIKAVAGNTVLLLEAVVNVIRLVILVVH